MKDKVRDMARSILPCKSRVTARWAKTTAHRTERRGAREDLAFYEGHLDRDLLDDCAPETRESREYRAAIGIAVNDRRNSDKVNPFLRWARARTRGIARPIAKYYRVKKLLGRSTVITDHALGHFFDERDRNPHYASGYFWRLARPKRAWPDIALVERLLVRAFESRHGELNAFLKGARRPVVQSRDDVRRLAREVWSLEAGSLLARAFARFLRVRGDAAGGAPSPGAASSPPA